MHFQLFQLAKLAQPFKLPRFSTRLNQSGQALTEYMTLLILVALVAVGAAQSLGKTVRQKIQTARSHVNTDITFDDVK